MCRRVFIVEEGHWGSVKPEDYKEQIEMYQRALEEAKDTHGSKIAHVELVKTAAEVKKRVRMEADIVLFISRGMEREAEEIARENPRVKVVVFTGAIPDGKVIWANKGWVDSRKEICNIVLHW